MFVSAIIAAGGRGSRLGAGTPKQLLDLGGRSMLARSVAAFDAHPRVSELIVVLPAELVADAPRHIGATARPVRTVDGGTRRQDSVANGFAAVSASAQIVLVHDAARPFVSATLIDRAIDGAAAHGAVIPALPTQDTVKRVHASAVVETIARETVFLAQTPQAFRRDVLGKAIEIGKGVEATDEGALAERAGFTVQIVEGDPENVKITTEDDLAAARRRLGRPARTGRAGIGYDLHRLVSGRPLVLGGVTIPFDRGLQGHSDADAVCHAITDALLGAAGAADIGRHFPDTDGRWKGASSLDLLRRAVALLREQGLEVGNVDATVIAEHPKLAPYVDAMRANLAGALGVAVDRVSLKGKTNEGVGELGRGEAIAVHAIALVRSA
jgi:2-C-methyl-D-erythritol 4-phosphate cytidylyltransferase / 2-C-methyl-D-erythritol 2,4-cyclodiphosphate synthase